MSAWTWRRSYKRWYCHLWDTCSEHQAKGFLRGGSGYWSGRRPTLIHKGGRPRR